MSTSAYRFAPADDPRAERTSRSAGAPASPSVPASTAPGSEAVSVSRVRALVAELAAAVEGAGTTEPRAMLDEVDRAINRMTTLRGRLLLAERKQESWRAAGYPSFEAWRAAQSRTGQRSAREQVGLAETLEAAPVAERDVSTGRISVEHASVLARVRRRVPERCDADLARGEDSDLLRSARLTDATAFSRAADRWVAEQEPRRHDAEHQGAQQRRFLHLSPTSDGTHIKGLLDPLAGHTLMLALEAATPRPGAEDDREPGQRRADALVSMAETALNGGEHKAGANVRPHVSIVMSPETLAALRTQPELWPRVPASAAGRDRSTGPGAGGPGAGGDGADSRPTGTCTGGSARFQRIASFAPATLEDGTPVPMSEVARILCDCEITRIAMTTDGTVTDLGRSTRLFTGEQRRAIIARDGWCQGPDCDAIARWCEIHHIAWWKRDGGSTSIPNGILLCRFHHQQVHRGNLIIDPATHTVTSATQSVTSATRAAEIDRAGAGRGDRPVENPGRGDPRVGTPGPGDPHVERPDRERPTEDLWTAADADPPAETRWRQNARAG